MISPAQQTATLNISGYKKWPDIAIPPVQRVCSLFKDKGYEIRVVGGAVRDVLQNKTPKDIDMATSATPQQIVNLCVEAEIRHIMTGFEHGTVTLMVDGIPLEVTTLRLDKETDGRHATVTFTTEFKLDAARRDLTINAMSVDMSTGELYDYFDGSSHLKEKSVLFVGDPAERIREDYLRILRYFRFYGRIAEVPNSFDTATIDAISSNKSGLKQISRERIWLEMKKIVLANFATDIIFKMRDLGLFPLINLDQFSLQIEEFEQVHSTGALDEMKPVTILSYLFKSSEDFSKLRKAWKMSSDEEYIGQFVIKHRGQTDVQYYQYLLVDTPTPCRHKFFMGFKELCYSTPGTDVLLTSLTSWDVPVCPIRGDDVIKTLSLSKGPLVHKYYTKGKTKWKESQYTLEKEDILEFLKKDYAKL